MIRSRRHKDGDHNTRGLLTRGQMSRGAVGRNRLTLLCGASGSRTGPGRSRHARPAGRRTPCAAPGALVLLLRSLGGGRGGTGYQAIILSTKLLNLLLLVLFKRTHRLPFGNYQVVWIDE